MDATPAPARTPGIQAFYPAGPRPRIRSAKGVWFEDTEGNRYMDASSGPVVSNLGHGNRRVLDAMAAQAEAVAYAYPLMWESEANIRLTERLTAMAGPPFDRAFLVSGGSEAVETALKFARQHAVVSGQPSRWKVVSRQPSYHGGTLGALAVTGDPAAHALYAPMLRPMPKVPAPLSYRMPPNHTQETYARACAEALEARILEEGPETVLAFIMEPVGGQSTGALVAPDAYYAAVRDICTRHGVLLIYDEVMAGAGRTGRFLAAHHWPAVVPDLVVLAKGITAGYTPLGALLAPSAMTDRVAAAGGFMHGFTYFSNPLSCAVGAAVLEELEAHDIVGNADRMGVRLRARLEGIAADSPIIGDVRGKGLLLAMELVADKATRRGLPLDRMAPSQIQALGMRHGLALYARRTGGGVDGEWLMITPPLIISAAEVDELADRLAATLAAYADTLRQERVI